VRSWGGIMRGYDLGASWFDRFSIPSHPVAGSLGVPPTPYLCKQVVCFQRITPRKTPVKSSFSTTYLQSRHSKGLTAFPALLARNFFPPQPYRTGYEHEKDGLRRPSLLFDLYFYFIKLDGFTTPGFGISFGEWNQWVEWNCLVLGP
jgi:hypothetical protein